MDLWKVERQLKEEGAGVLCGCDEAGAGPLAGPVCAAAVILPYELEIEGLNDSKRLSEKKREDLYEVIIRQALAWAVAWASEKEIDEINILNARMLAMDRAIRALDIKPDLALIDGNRSKGISVPCRTLVKGDSISASIAAASILAKVSRDRLMKELDIQYPQYGFAAHKGYGTKAHYEALREYGPCEIHRRTFLKKMH